MKKKLSKSCSKCKLDRDIDEFHKSSKGKFGRVSVCKLCRRALSKENSVMRAKYDKAYRKDNRKRIAKYASTWRSNNKEKTLEYQRRYRSKHKNKVRAKAAKYVKQRLKYNINAKLANNIRARIYKATKYGGSALQELGCSMTQLKEYMESQFYTNRSTGEMMDWNNYGKWHIDHIRPLVSFDLSDIKQFKVACHYTNLQPLWAYDNLSKGGSYNDKSAN